MWKRATTPCEVSPTDFVPKEIEEKVVAWMGKWSAYVKQDLKEKRQEEFYSERHTNEYDEETKAFFESKLNAIIDSRHVGLSNISNANAKVRRIVNDMCKVHNDALAEQESRKRKSPEKSVATSERGTPKQPMQKKKKLEIVEASQVLTMKKVVAAPARQETPLPPRESTPPPPRQDSPQAVIEPCAHIEE